jgi:hypothetical protein
VPCIVYRFSPRAERVAISMKIEQVQQFLDEMAAQLGVPARYIANGHSRGRIWNITAEEDGRQRPLQMEFTELEGSAVLCSVTAREHADRRGLAPGLE